MLFRSLFKAIFRFGTHIKIEDKLSLANQRNILVVVTAICFPMSITLFCGELLAERFDIPKYLLLIYLYIVLISYWIFKTSILRLCSWITGEKRGFLMIGKIGYSHFIVLFFASIPLFLLSAIPYFPPLLQPINLLIILTLIIYIIYVVRGFQIIISSQFSHFFYILYLCAAELLPLLFIVKLAAGV